MPSNAACIWRHRARITRAGLGFALLILAACSDNSVVIDEVEGHPFEGEVVLSRDGSLLAIRLRSNRPSRTFDLAIFDTKEGELRHQFPFDATALTKNVFHPDGKRVVSIGGNRICLWSLETRSVGACTSPLAAQLATAFFTADGRNVIAVPAAGAAPVIFDSQTMTEVKRLAVPDESRPDPFGGPPRDARLSDNGERLLAFGTPIVEIIDTTNWTTVTWAQHRPQKANIWDAQISADGSVLLIESPGAAILWSVPLHDALRRFEDLPIGAQPDLTPDGTKLVVVTQDRAVTVWNGRTGEEAVRLPPQGNTPPRAAAFDPRGEKVVVVFDDCSAAEFDAATVYGKNEVPASGIKSIL